MAGIQAIPAEFLSFGNIVNGNKVSQDRPTYHSVDPRTGKSLWVTPIAIEEDVVEAINAASEASSSWAGLKVEQRGEMLYRWADKIKENYESLVSVVEVESGKPLSLAQNEVDLTIINLKKYAKFDISRPEELVSDGRKITLRWVPRGVTLGITPFNFPILIGAGKIAASLMAGCPIIVKPSPYTPYSTLKIAEFGLGIIPPGVLQELGAKDQPQPWLAQRLIADPKIDVISFTGSSKTARKVRIAAADSQRPKRVVEELGGNNPTIVCHGVEVRKVAREIVEDVMRNCGQVCVSSSRIYVPGDLYDDFRQEIGLAAEEYPTTGRLGPLQNETHYIRLRELTAKSAAEGCKFISGGIVHSETGFFMKPTIVDNPSQDSLIANEEAFGPLACLFPYSDIENAIELANRGNNNLAACVYSPLTSEREYIASKIQAGTIFHNSFARPKGDVPMPGCGGSGIGNEGGLEGVREFCRLKVEHLSLV